MAGTRDATRILPEREPMGGNTVSKGSGLRAVVAPAARCVNLRYALRSMPMLRYLLSRSVLVRVLLAMLVVGGLSTGCTTPTSTPPLTT